MDYIINPAWFYWAEVIDTLKSFFALMSGLSIAVLCVALISLAVITYLNIGERDEWKTDTTLAKKIAILSLVISIITGIGTIFIPSKKVLTEMLIAENLTKSNIECIEEEVKELTDYIFDKFNEKE